MGSITAKTENRNYVKNIFGRSVMRSMEQDFSMSGSKDADKEVEQRMFASMNDYVELA